MKVKDFFEIKMCKRIYKDERSLEGEIPFYTIKNLGATPDDYISSTIYEEYVNKYDFPTYGSTMITCSGTIGKLWIYDGKPAYFQDSNIMWLKPISGDVDSTFIFYYLSSINWNRLNSSTITRLYKSDLEELEFKLFSLEEQRKIGYFHKGAIYV